MRYTSSHPHAFRNRIAKSIGVLVAAALIATLGLPGAAQAQAGVDTTISFAGWRWLHDRLDADPLHPGHRSNRQLDRNVDSAWRCKGRSRPAHWRSRRIRRRSRCDGH